MGKIAEAYIYMPWRNNNKSYNQWFIRNARKKYQVLQKSIKNIEVHRYH